MSSASVYYQDDHVTLIHGRWQDALDAGMVPQVDAVITDPPYSERTHAGSDGAVARSGDGAERRELGYVFLTNDDVRNLVHGLAPITTSWCAFLTDDILAPTYRGCAADEGRYDFAPVPILQHKPRLSGDGPGSGTVWLCTSRPRAARFMKWGSLPSRYMSRPAKFAGVQGSKPLQLMRALVRDYSRPGDLILDPCAGGGTTALAARLEGRRCITIERDEATCEIAKRRLSTMPIETAKGQTALFGDAS